MNREEEKKSIYVILDGYVYDLTDFVEYHPGGPSIIEQCSGDDVTKLFYSVKSHNDTWVLDRLDTYCLGPVDSIPLISVVKKN